MSEYLAPRLRWPPNFPNVVVHTTVKARDEHVGYHLAKAGDRDSALALALDLMTEAGMADVHALLGGRDASLLPVVADEVAGFNVIPDAMAQVLGSELALPVIAGEIVQTNKVGHTRAPTFQRIVTPATFGGRVQSNRNYVLVDDHVGLGGTLASLRGYVERSGGAVVGITTLTESKHGRQISLLPDTLSMLKKRHGDELDQFWQEHFGYGIDCLTEIEALNLCRQPSVAAIEDFLAKAAVEASSRGLQPAVEPA